MADENQPPRLLGVDLVLGPDEWAGMKIIDGQAVPMTRAEVQALLNRLGDATRPRSQRQLDRFGFRMEKPRQ